MSGNVPADIKETLSLMQGLLDDLQVPERELDEATFTKVFLPLLTSKEEVDLRAWVAIAGSPTGRVSVYRMENGVKKQLYVVPPLVNVTGFTKTQYNHQDSIWERVQTAMRRIRNAPMQAKRIYDEEMSRAAIDDVKLPLSDAMQWNYILEVNGIKPDIPVSAGEKGTVHDKGTITTEGWDDF